MNASSTIKLSSFPSCAAPPRVAAATARNCGKRSNFLRVSAEQQQRYETSADASSSSSSSSSSLLVHTVAPGDSLYGVAMQYDVDPRDLIVRFSLFCLSSSPFLKRKRIHTALRSSEIFEFLFFFFEFDSCVDSNTKNVREYCNIDVVVLSFFLSFFLSRRRRTRRRSADSSTCYRDNDWSCPDDIQEEEEEEVYY